MKEIEGGDKMSFSKNCFWIRAPEHSAITKIEVFTD